METIRMIGPDDWMAFRDVRLASLADAPAAFGSTLADAQRRTDADWEAMVRARTTSDGSALWLAELSGAGTIGVVAADPNDARVANELVSMWVAPSARGTGLAQRLVDTVVTWARSSGSASVSLWVMRGNDRARRLYESAGFVVVDRQAAPDDPCRDEIRMSK
ncbi:MAG: GNAT family N-acetyltransferase, partial [Ilumatobacter sp.]